MKDKNGMYLMWASLLTLATTLFVGLELDLHSIWKVIASVVTGVPMLYFWYQFKKTL